MKKILTVFICALIALYFAGCGAPETKKSYTYKFGNITEEEDLLLESYLYHVESAEQDEDSTLSPPYYVDGSGEYRVNIYQHIDGEVVNFKIETSLTFTGKYKYKNGGESDEFTDTVQAVSYAEISSFSFTPISAEKTYNINLPEYSSEEDGYVLKSAKFTAKTEYGKDGNKLSVKSTITDSDGEKKIQNEDNKSVSITVDGGYVENEQIFLQLRLQNIDAAFRDNFKVYDSINAVLKNMTVYSSETFEDKYFYGDDNASNKYTCYVLTAMLDGKYKGSDTVMYFAQDFYYDYLNKSGGYDKVNVNLLMEFKHGNLIYQLEEYNNFAEKQQN